MAEVWEQAVLLAGMILFAVLAGLLYYLTSDSYRKSKKMAQLGHEVTTLWTVCARCCLFCVGPAYRKKWESENRQYRTEDYGQPDSSGCRPPLAQDVARARGLRTLACCVLSTHRDPGLQTGRKLMSARRRQSGSIFLAEMRRRKSSKLPSPGLLRSSPL